MSTIAVRIGCNGLVVHDDPVRGLYIENLRDRVTRYHTEEFYDGLVFPIHSTFMDRQGNTSIIRTDTGEIVKQLQPLTFGSVLDANYFHDDVTDTVYNMDNLETCTIEEWNAQVLPHQMSISYCAETSGIEVTRFRGLTSNLPYLNTHGQYPLYYSGSNLIVISGIDNCQITPVTQGGVRVELADTINFQEGVYRIYRVISNGQHTKAAIQVNEEI